MSDSTLFNWSDGSPETMSDLHAIHDNEAGEIHAVTEKTSPASNDELLLEDSAASYAKKRVKISNLIPSTSTDPDAIHDNVASEISAVTEKSIIVADDLFLIEDSAASNAKKRVKQINVDPFRPFSVTFGDGVNNIPANSSLRLPVPFDMTLTYWFFNTSVSVTSMNAYCRYYNGTSWDTNVYTISAYTGTNTGGSLSKAIQKHTVASQRLLEFWITGGTAKQATFTLYALKTGNF